ncbi:MAG: cytochrome d ubiquinol oxidase subunit II [Thermoanaerobaculia bacterium]
MIDLQTTWFLLVGVLLVGYAVLDGFDLGVGALHLFLARTDRERRILLNSVGPVWDGNEVWLLTGGGAIFAAFPNVYATVFSGLYLALMLLLAGLIFRAVSLEFRSKNKSPRWRFGWDLAFSAGSFLPALLFGVAIGNVLRGLPIGSDGEFAGTFLGLLNPFALSVGLLALAMFVMQGAAWLVLKTQGELQERSKKACFGSWAAFAALWVSVTLISRSAAPHQWIVYGRPLAWVVPVLFLFATLGIPLALRRNRHGWTLTLTSAAIALLIAVMGLGLYPDMIPAAEASRSLTIYNSSSTSLTLKVMLAIALFGMPIVVGYTAFIYSRFRGPVVLDDASY